MKDFERINFLSNEQKKKLVNQYIDLAKVDPVLVLKFCDLLTQKGDPGKAKAVAGWVTVLWDMLTETEEKRDFKLI